MSRNTAEYHASRATVKKYDLLECILNNLNTGIVAVDLRGKIIYYNQVFIDILSDTNYLDIHEKYLKELDQTTLIGRNILDVFPQSQLPAVIETGKSEVSEIKKVKGEYYITSRFPLVNENNESVGAAAKVYLKNFDEIKELAAKIEALNDQLSYYKRELHKKNEHRTGLERIISKNKQIIEIKKTAYAAAKTTSTILITGESGTGKDFLAEAIHQSSRPGQSFVALNCASIPENLLEAELFGYAPGTFTGGLKGGKLGKLEAAHQGTLFLDEIGDMSYQLQAKLLRFLQNRNFYSIGGDKQIEVDVRIIAATNKNLENMIIKEQFREDLYYRLNVIRISVPPLRERSEDIELLTNYFITKYNSILNCNVKGIAPEALAVLQSYCWPGNIRELENLVERTMNFVQEGIINQAHLPSPLVEAQGAKSGLTAIVQSPGSDTVITRNETSLNKQLIVAEKKAIEDALQLCDGNRTKTAALLGISRAWLYRKIKKYELS